MPFSVTAAAAHVRRIVLKFNQEKLEIKYNAGEKYREYQLKAQKLDQEFSDLNRRLQAEGASDEDYQKLVDAVKTARRRIADNICTVIESWDLEGDRDSIKQNMPEKDRKQFKDLTGEGEIPVSGAWLDALPLPDEFILRISEGITSDFDTGGAGGKGR
jgi:small-conductance mechanosensitive channel